MMKALVIDHSQTSGVRLDDVATPIPKRDEALVAVRAASVNSGDVHGVLAHGADGSVPGWEAAGIVERPAADGSGPAAGSPVVTVGNDNAWAEFRAVPTSAIAPVPEHADLAAVSTVAIAGVSALSALHRLSPILGRRLLITGASGGVGRYVLQLARLGGAEVVAVVQDPAAHGDDLRLLGAHRVVSTDQLLAGECDSLVDGVVDLVGGPLLVAGFKTLDRNGTLISLGHLSHEPESFAPGVLLSNPGQDNRKIVTFFMPESTDQVRGMTWLAEQVTNGTIDPGIAWRGHWARAGEAIEHLRSRRLQGKAVLEIDPSKN